MSSSDQVVNMVAATRGAKLCLDSEEEQKRDEQQRQIQQQIRQKKQEKRKRREQAERLEREKILLEEQKEKKYEDPELMFQQDSQQGIQFKRVAKKIRKTYPEATNRHQIKKRKDFIADSEEDSEDSDSESGEQSSNHKRAEKKTKKIEKVQKKQKRPQKRSVEKKAKVQTPIKKQKVKTEHISDRKQNLVRQISIRWWYALPEWPPIDFDYEAKLKELGYRNVNDALSFANAEQLVNGLLKAYPVDGYLGMYRTKNKLIDVRPKEIAPTMNNFRAMSTQELTDILRKALTVQIQQLKQVKLKQLGQDSLLKQLQKQLYKLK